MSIDTGSTTTLCWGVKQSLRTYVAGVGGEFAADAPARLDDGIVVLPLVSDSSEDGVRVLRFAGTIRIYAHSGMMNVRWADLQIELADAGARLTVAGDDPGDERVTIAVLQVDAGTDRRFGAVLADGAVGMFGGTYAPGTALDDLVLVD